MYLCAILLYYYLFYCYIFYYIYFNVFNVYYFKWIFFNDFNYSILKVDFIEVVDDGFSFIFYLLKVYIYL